jgi:hypothetical protein
MNLLRCFLNIKDKLLKLNTYSKVFEPIRKSKSNDTQFRNVKISFANLEKRKLNKDLLIKV